MSSFLQWTRKQASQRHACHCCRRSGLAHLPQFAWDAGYLGFQDQGPGLRVKGLEYRALSLGFWLREFGLGKRDSGLGCGT